MDTVRLKSIQVPSNTLRLLEAFAQSRMGLTPGVACIAQLGELPLQLRRRIGNGPDQHYVWLAWTSNERIRLVTGALALERSRERGRPVLDVRVYDENGLLDEASTWLRAESDRWERCDW